MPAYVRTGMYHRANAGAVDVLPVGASHARLPRAGASAFVGGDAYAESILPILEGVVSVYGILRAVHVAAVVMTVVVAGAGGGGLCLGLADAAGRGGPAGATVGDLPRVAQPAYTL